MGKKSKVYINNMVYDYGTMFHHKHIEKNNWIVRWNDLIKKKINNTFFEDGQGK